MSRLTQNKGLFFGLIHPPCDLTQDGDIQQRIQSMLSAFPLSQFSWEHPMEKKELQICRRKASALSLDGP